MAQRKAKPAVLFDASKFPGLAFDRSAPRFRLSVFRKGQKNVSESRALSQLVTSFEIEEDDKMATNIKINFDNPEFTLSRQDSLLQPGTLLVMETGYGKGLFGQRRAGEVVRLLPDFPRSNKPTYDIQAYDGRQRLLDVNTLSDRGIDSGQKKEFGKLRTSFKRVRDTDIIEQIAVQFGFATDIDFSLLDGKRRTRVKKNDQTWWDFILKLASKNNAEAWVDWDPRPTFRQWVIRFKKKNHFAKPGLKLVYGESLLEFHPQLDSIGQSTSVQVVHFDRKIKRNRIVNASDRAKSGVGGLVSSFSNVTREAAVVKVLVSGKMQHIFSDKPFKNRKDAQRFAEEYVRKNREDYIIATGSTIGIEILQPRQVHQIVTGDKRFDGEYYFTQVSHKYPARDMYENSFVAYRVPAQFANLITKSSHVNFAGEKIEVAAPIKLVKGVVDFGDGNLYI